MVPISPQVFSGGAVVFDTRSLFDYQQRLAERRAKRDAAEQEALDNYLKELGKTPDPYGMRKNDIPTFNKKLNDFRQLSNDFKKAPKNLESRLKLQQAADDLKIFVARSKEEKEKDKSYNNLIADLAANPEKRKTTNVEKLIADKTNQDLPLDFPGVAMLGIPARVDKEFNPNYYKPAPVSIYDLFEKNKGGVEFGPGKRITATDKDYNYIEESKYTPEGIETIALRIGDRVKTDPNLADSFGVKGKLYTSEDLANFKATLQKYPRLKNIDVIEDDPVSIAIAESVAEGELRKEQKKAVDTKAKIAYEKSFKDKETADGVGRNIYKEIDLATSSPQRLKGGTGAPVNILSGDAQRVLIKLANDVTGKDSYNQSNIYVKKFPNGKNYIVDVETDEPLVPFTKEDINVGVQVDVKGKRGALTGEVPVPEAIKKENSYSIKGKNYTESQLLKMGYTKEQIAPYIKK